MPTTPLPTLAPSQIATQVQVLGKGWLSHKLSVQCPEGVYQVKYDGWGMGYERVLVNGVEVARLDRRKLGTSMSARFEILLGNRPAALTVVFPWWKYLFIIPWLSHVQFELEGRVLYDKGHIAGKKLRTIVMSCRWCWYDIRATVLAGKETCPECGGALPLSPPLPKNQT